MVTQGQDRRRNRCLCLCSSTVPSSQLSRRKVSCSWHLICREWTKLHSQSVLRRRHTGWKLNHMYWLHCTTVQVLPPHRHSYCSSTGPLRRRTIRGSVTTAKYP